MQANHTCKVCNQPSTEEVCVKCAAEITALLKHADTVIAKRMM